MKKFRTLITDLGQEIKVRANNDNSFTIITNGTTYQTVDYMTEEFEEMEYNTANDWAYFLRSTHEYYPSTK